MTAHLHLRLQPDPGGLGVMADAVQKFAAQEGLDAAAAIRLTTALDEILTNVVSHGGVPGDSVIDLRLSRHDGVVTAVVEDRGPAFDPLAVATAPDLDAAVAERRIGGLGLHIVLGLVEEIAYVRTRQRRNRLTLKLRA